MDVVVFGATGNIGSAIVEELVARDHHVTGVTRSAVPKAGPPTGLQLRVGDVTDPASVAEVVRGSDVVVSAVGPAAGSGEEAPFAAAARALVAGLREAGVSRILIVGGAGSLEVSPGVQAVDAPDFPEAYKLNALAQREALQYYRTVEDLDWTYVSPAAEIGPRPHVKDYQLGHRRMLFAEDGASHIGYADYADGVVDCLEQGSHLREQITLAD